MNIELSSQQKIVSNSILEKIDGIGIGHSGYYLTTVGGFAGTGKTTLITELRKKLQKEYLFMSVAFCTFTGKASSVLRKKLTENNALFDQDYCGTIHGLIYEPEVRWDKKLKTFVVVGWKRKPTEEFGYHLIIIDESSMISKEIFSDLKKLNKPIIAFGDHAQLPPIGDKFELIKNPEFVLSEIHRQSLNSPIIKLSKIVREEGYIPYGFFSDKVFKMSWNQEICKKIWNEKINFIDNDLVILCGFNTTRANLNLKIRDKLQYKERPPYPCEKVVCLSNNHNLKIMNGQIGNVIWLMADDNLYSITLEIDGDIYDCLVANKCFGEVVYTMYDNKFSSKALIEKCADMGYKSIDFFDYGYVISVHKSQGSEWNKCVLIEQRTKRWDDEYYMRWLYTAVTRAKESLFVITDMWI